MTRAAILQPPANFADRLSGDMAATLSFMNSLHFEQSALRSLKIWRRICPQLLLVKRFAGKAYTAMGKSFHMALMEWLLLTGMPITGDALESPFFLPDPQAPALPLQQLLAGAPARRVWLQQRALSFKDAHVPSLQAAEIKTQKEILAGTMGSPMTEAQ
eukprot:3145364-Amphidinium_carterae.1